VIFRQRSPASRHAFHRISGVIVNGGFGEAVTFRSSPQTVHHRRIFDLKHA
jgi:hypothetical protein